MPSEIVKAFRGPAVRRAVQEGELADLAAAVHGQTEIMARLATGLLNGVLDSGTYLIGADGYATESYNVAGGSLVVINYSASNDMTVVTSGPGAGAAPTSGKGVFPVPAGAVLTLPLGSRTWTVYGTAGDQVGIQAFTGMLAAGVGTIR